MTSTDRRLAALTWHVHGNYLWYLSAVPVTWYLPVRPDRPPGYGGRGDSFTWPDNVVEVPADQVRDLDIDVVVHQSHRDWEIDRHELLDDRLRAVPAVVVEHDPPLGHPTDTRHPVDDPAVTVVHVSAYNRLMWDCGRSRTVTINHGVWPSDEEPAPLCEARGIVVVNHLARRGRRLGADLVSEIGQRVPLDVVGMGAEETGGIGEVPPVELRHVMRRYRFFFHPARYTSFGLAVCEAMHEGIPIVGLPTTELPNVVRDGEEGFLAADVDTLVARMCQLVDDRQLALRLGAKARRTAQERLGIDRFVSDWLDLLTDVATARTPVRIAG
jgi:glycosyltransferase involved in cell wall biosynthesis